MAAKKTTAALDWKKQFCAVLGTLWVIFVVVWLYVYAGSYNVYQNIAVVLLSVLVVAIIKCLARTFLGIEDGTSKMKWCPCC